MVSDEILMIEFQRGSRPAFDELYARYNGPLYGFFRRRTQSPQKAEDLTQETFLAVIHGASRYEPRALLRTYLYSIALNLLMADQRKYRNETALPDPDSEPTTQNTPDTVVWIRNAMQKLGPLRPPRSLCSARSAEHFSYTEITPSFSSTSLSTPSARASSARASRSNTSSNPTPPQQPAPANQQPGGRNNMRNDIHSVAPEDVMAYLDGELPVEEAAHVAAHLGQCSDCQQIVAGLRHVSRSTMSWEIEPHTDQIPPQITTALNERDANPSATPIKKSWRSHWAFTGRRPWLWGIPATALAAVIVLFFLAVPREQPSPMAMKARSSAVAPPPTTLTMIEPASNDSSSFQDKKRALNESNLATALRSRDTVASQSQVMKSDRFIGGPLPASSTSPASYGAASLQQGAPSAAPPPAPSPAPSAAPMIARTADLMIQATNLDRARTRLDEILRQHRGYLGNLNVSSPAEGGRNLNASLRLPADQLDAALADLRTLGRVLSESQNGEEITAEYVDLVARLQNARNTETRLTDLLRNHTGKLSDVLEVETEISRVRGQIEQMEAEKKLLETRVAFSTIRITIGEEFKAQAQVIPNSTGTRFRNAAIDGYQTAVNGLVAILLFFISAGPTLLLWAAILLPARYLWRRKPAPELVAD